MKMIIRALDAAREGCNTSEDLAEELGICVNRASAYASQLIKLGFLRRTGAVCVNKFGEKTLKVFELAGGDDEKEEANQRAARRPSEYLSIGRV